MPEREGHCRRIFRWRKTSSQELEHVDQRILQSLSCVQEKKFVEVGEGNSLWTVTCNPHHQGTPIIMVHGMGGGVGFWALNLEALSRKRPVYTFDLLGFGRSSRPSFSRNAKEAEDMFVQSIENYRKAMGLDRFILLGHSLGGFLSASYALRHPQHIQHLILVDPWGMNQRPPEGRRNLPLFVRAVTSVLSLGNPMSVLRALGPLGPRLVKKYRPGLAEMFTDKLGDKDLLHHYIYHCNAQKPSGETGFKSMTWNIGWAKEPMIERMEALDPQIPVTFIYGEESWIDRNTGLDFKKSRDGYVDVQIVKGAGHHVYAERWDVFNMMVKSIANSVDHGELPDLDKSLVQRIHSDCSMDQFHAPHPEDPDFERPWGHRDENTVCDDVEEGEGRVTLPATN